MYFIWQKCVGEIKISFPFFKFMLMSMWVRYYSSVWYQNLTDNIANVCSRILVCSSQPQCCCFSPVKPSLLFAGMVDGSVAMWDLREPSSIHQSVVMNEETYSLRYPTYDTGDNFFKIYSCSVTQFKVYSSSVWEVIDWLWKKIIYLPMSALQAHTFYISAVCIKQDIVLCCRNVLKSCQWLAFLHSFRKTLYQMPTHICLYNWWISCEHSHRLI